VDDFLPVQWMTITIQHCKRRARSSNETQSQTWWDNTGVHVTSIDNMTDKGGGMVHSSVRPIHPLTTTTRNLSCGCYTPQMCGVVSFFKPFVKCIPLLLLTSKSIGIGVIRQKSMVS